MKKILVIILWSFLITWCFWATKDDWLIDYDKSQYFSMRIPNNWEIIENKDWILPKPRSWNIELAVSAKDDNKWFFLNNLLILSEDLKTEISASDYIESATLKNDENYFEFKKISEKEINFSDWNKSSISIFEARYNDRTPKIKFLQTANICKNNKWFFLTIAIPTSVENTSKYEYMLSTFWCKK